MSPRVSVIIPTKDRRAMLERSVASVLRQSFRDLEVIVVDDGPEVEPADWVETLDPRIRHVRLEHSRGPSAARNVGIRGSTGAYIAFLDDDDEWYPDKLERQVRILDAAPSDVGVVYSGRELRTPQGLVRLKAASGQGDIYDRLFGLMRGIPVHVDSMLVRRESLLDAGLFDEDIPFAEIWELCVRLAKRWKFAAIPEPLIVQWRHPAGISRDSARVIAGRRRIFEKHRAEVERHPEFDSLLHLTLGVHELRRRNVAQARRDLARAIRVRPWNFKAVAYYLLSYDSAGVRETFVRAWRLVSPRRRWLRGSAPRDARSRSPGRSGLAP